MSTFGSDAHIVVVGGSIAGVTAARSVRGSGHAGPVTLISAEPHPPYARPPLSKGVLVGTESAGSAELPPLQDIDLRLGTPAAHLDPTARQVTLVDGSTVGYDGLVIATGARARTIDGGGSSGRNGKGGVWTLRTLDDALALGERIRSALRMVVIGGGPLGMEVASVARDLDTQVTVISDRAPLCAQLGDHLAGTLVDAARDAGVEVVVDPAGAQVDGTRSRPAAVLGDGRRVEADLLLVAVGDRPNTEWLEGSGLDSGAHGVVVDQHLRAAPGIVVAGDVVALPGTDGLSRRSPFWSNAVDQAMAAVDTLLDDDPAPYRARPYFWTEQFGHTIKIVGSACSVGRPDVVERPSDASGTVLRWAGAGGSGGAATVDCPMPVGRLRRHIPA